ncbi:MAG: hypothetical protein ACI9DF_006003 [Verrucomicrobiales bacterium]|jgi:hypothetical protein
MGRSCWHSQSSDRFRLNIITRGPAITQTINSHLMSALVDEDTQGRIEEGVLGTTDAHWLADEATIPQGAV